ncbi:MAG: hypothetical protein QOD51_147 [Candidatus Eremiobacteraeota bacterium]|nr:hypothetical protein [Candidatus Eremiobacteraeota bacterium]
MRVVEDHTASPGRLSAAVPGGDVASLLANARFASPKRLNRFGWRAFSQADEDGIIQEIFARIGVTTRRFLEVGAGNGLENNTAYLIACGWSGTWIEADPGAIAAILRNCAVPIDAGRLAVVGAAATPANVNDLVRDSGMSGDIDLLSLDIDGNDLHVLRSLDAVHARAIVVEYNASYRPPVRWVMQYDPDHRWDGTNYFGASLSAFQDLLAARGYALVGCNLSGANAFFVRTDLVADRFEAPFTAENHYEPPRFYLVGEFAKLSGHPPRLGRALVDGADQNAAELVTP